MNKKEEFAQPVSEPVEAPEAKDFAQPVAQTSASAGQGSGVGLFDFYAYMPKHLFIFAPNGEMWPAASINSRLPKIPVMKKDGTPALDSKGKPRKISPSVWLDRTRPVEQMTWAPGLPQIIANRLISKGGWFDRDGVAVFNLYIPPVIKPGNADNAGRWVELVQQIYPGAAAKRIITFCAHCIQHPAIKINHALLLGGCPGIGKDTILEPLKYGVGPWNFREASPQDIMGPWNDYMEGVVLRISETRDLGEVNRYAFHNHMKTISAAPPDVKWINSKYAPKHYSVNVVAVIYTTNHRFDSLYLPADDRRTDVEWSDARSTDFGLSYWKEMWRWYGSGGIADVVAYLREYDLSQFDPKAPPPKTEAFWQIARHGEAPEVSELNDVLDAIGIGPPDANGTACRPVVTTLSMVMAGTSISGRYRRRRRRLSSTSTRSTSTACGSGSTRWRHSGRASSTVGPLRGLFQQTARLDLVFGSTDRDGGGAFGCSEGQSRTGQPGLAAAPFLAGGPGRGTEAVG